MFLIENAKKLIEYNNELQTVINGISKDESAQSITTRYMPILLIASTDLNLENTETSNLIIGKEKYQKRIETEIKKLYFEIKDQLCWIDCADPEKKIVSHLVKEKISQKRNFDARTKNMMLKLLDESYWQTLGGIQ